MPTIFSSLTPACWTLRFLFPYWKCFPCKVEGFGSELSSLGSAIQEQGQVSWSDRHCSGLGKHWVVSTEGTWPTRPCFFVNACLLVAAVVVRTWPLCCGLGIPKVSSRAWHNALFALDEDSTALEVLKSSQVHLQQSLFLLCCRLTLDLQAWYVNTLLPLSYIPIL